MFVLILFDQRIFTRKMESETFLLTGDEALTNYRKISADYGFGESPVTTDLLKPKSCLTRSKSAPVGKLPLHASSPLPRVTLNDFSALTIDPVEEIQDFQQSDTFTCVTLEDVRCAKLFVQKQKSFEFDTWSCTNSSIGTSLDEQFSESEKEDILEPRKLTKKVGRTNIYGVYLVIYNTDYLGDVLGLE